MVVRIFSALSVRNKFSFRAWLAALVALLFFGAVFWAKGRDPFERKWFSLKTANHGTAKCVAVLPKTAVHPLPVIVYLHGSGGSLLGSGNELRQMAEIGLAAVGIQYNQTNDVACEAEFAALLDRLQGERWADTNTVAWVGFSLGAQRQLSFLLKHPESQPRLLVRLAGGWIPELESFQGSPSPRPSPPGEGEALRRKHPTSNIQHPTSNGLSTLNSQLPSAFLIHSDQDSVFPVADVERVATVFRTNGVPVDVKILAGQSHGLDSNRALVFRAIGEYCLTHLKGRDALKNYRSIALWQSQAKPLWVYWLPALVWLCAWLVWRRRVTVMNLVGDDVRRLTWKAGHEVRDSSRRLLPDEGTAQPHKLTRWEIRLRWVAAILAILAISQTALHLIPPRLLISERTLAIAREHLIQPNEKADFDFLAANPVWQGKRLKTLLTHVELAHYNRELVNWKLDDRIYRESVLSAQIDPVSDGEMNWRRQLWESFYPRIRKEQNVEAAAEIVVRHLRERVTIVEGVDSPKSITDIWLRQITNADGFEAIYVAALRAAGIPARLNPRDRAEFWSDAGWKPAPRSLIEAAF